MFLGWLKMKISIIIPCYNCEKTIASTIESILNQTYQDFEIIICNDGSTDNLLDVISKYLDDNRIVLINKDNGGVASSNSYAIRQATGNIIMFIDGDDKANNDLFETIINNIEDYDLLGFGFKKINEKNKLIGYKSLNNIQYKNKDEVKDLMSKYYFDNHSFSAFKNLFVYRWSIAFKKEIIDQIIDEYERLNFSLYEDYVFISLALEKAKKVKTIDYIGIDYLQLKNSHSRINQKDYDDLYFLRKNLRKYIHFYSIRNNLDEDIFLTMEFDVSKFYLSRIIKRSSFKESKRLFKLLKKDEIYNKSKSKVSTKDESFKRKVYFYFLKHNIFICIFFAFKCFMF